MKYVYEHYYNVVNDSCSYPFIVRVECLPALIDSPQPTSKLAQLAATFINWNNIHCATYRNKIKKLKIFLFILY